MNRKRLAVLIGLIILVFAAAVMLWPDNGAEPHSEEETEESDLPEGLVLLGEEQIRSSEIMVETVGEGSAVELVFPATIAASPTGSARIDARAAGVGELDAPHPGEELPLLVLNEGPDKVHLEAAHRLSLRPVPGLHHEAEALCARP